MAATVIFVKAKERKKVEIKYRLTSISREVEGSKVHWIAESRCLDFNIMAKIEMGKVGAKKARGNMEKLLEEAKKIGDVVNFEIHKTAPAYQDN